MICLFFPFFFPSGKPGPATFSGLAGGMPTSQPQPPLSPSYPSSEKFVVNTEANRRAGPPPPPFSSLPFPPVLRSPPLRLDPPPYPKSCHLRLHGCLLASCGRNPNPENALSPSLVREGGGICRDVTFQPPPRSALAARGDTSSNDRGGAGQKSDTA